MTGERTKYQYGLARLNICIVACITSDGNNLVKVNSLINGITFFSNSNLTNYYFHLYNPVAVAVTDN